MEFEREKISGVVETQSGDVSKVRDTSLEVSETGKKLLDFFDRFGTDPEKIATFEQNLMSAQNVAMKKEVDAVVEKIQAQAQENPQSQLNQTLKQEEKSNEGQKVIEICLMCGRKRNECAGYATMGDRWPYMREFTTNDR